MFLFIKGAAQLFLALALIVLGSCTSEALHEDMPAGIMPFVYPLKIVQNNLFAAATNHDARYDPQIGRLASVNITRVKSKLPTTSVLDASVIDSFYTIESGSNTILTFDNNFLYVSQSFNTLHAGKLNAQGLLDCSEAKFSTCPNTHSFSLEHKDPAAVEKLENNANGLKIIVSYHTSDALDVLNVQNGISKLFTLKAADWISDIKSFERIFVHKILSITNNAGDKKTYFLLNQTMNESYRMKEGDKMRKISYLVGSNTNEILNNNLDAANLDIFDLSELFGIKNATDFYMDGNNAVILAQEPFGLYRFDVVTKKLIDRADICMGAHMMAVSKAKDLIVLPCFDSGKVFSFYLTSLKKRAEFVSTGETPAYAAIHDGQDLVFVSYFREHQVKIFDMNLKLNGILFEKPQN